MGSYFTRQYERGLLSGVALMRIGLLQANGAIGADSSKQEKGKGMVNERSTDNEPFTGPGSSGGPSHSAPGAMDQTIQEGTSSQSGMGNAGEEKGAGAGKSETSKKSGSGSAGGAR
jgi:hypothetical protein